MAAPRADRLRRLTDAGMERRMAEAIRNEVVALRRVGFGSLRLGRLAEGDARRLDAPEVERLWKDARRDEH